MPELPEVETICSGLRNGGAGQPGILGAVITEVLVRWPRTIQIPSVEEFTRQVEGKSICAIRRRGKYVIVELDRGFLAIHLRMSGDLLVRAASAEAQSHDRLILFLSQGRQLAFNDPRKFGRAWYLEQVEQVTGALGPEPLEEALTAEQLYQKLQRSQRRLKPLLMDQAFLAGLGNIYTDEALFLSRLHPLLPANRLNFHQASALLESIRQVLKEGILNHGASIDWVYRGGEFQNHFRVYQRTGAACQVCGTSIERMVVGQRGTHYCPSCQKSPDA